MDAPVFMLLPPPIPEAAPAIAWSIQATAAVGFAAALAAVAWLGRARMPRGFGEGLLVASLSGAILLGIIGSGDEPRWSIQLGHGFTGLAAVWTALAWLLGAAAAQGADHAAEGPRNSAGEIPAEAAFVAGVLAIANAGALALDADAAQRSALVLDLLAVAVLALAGATRGCIKLPVPLLAGVLGAGAWLAVCADPLSPVATISAWGWLAGAGAVVALTIGASLVNWFRRRAAWLVQPDLLMLPRARVLPVTYAVAALSVAVTLGLLFRGCGVATPVLLLILCLCCGAAGHIANQLVLAEIGLLIASMAVASVVPFWLVGGWAGWLIGLGFACVHMLWLGRFWQQQLGDGPAWTTAGRLIPATRRCAQAAAAASLAISLAALDVSRTRPPEPLWPALLAGVVLLAAALLQLRTAADERVPGLVLGALCAAVAAATPLRPVILVFCGVDPGILWPVAILVVLLAARMLGLPRDARVDAAGNAWMGSFVPVAALFALTLRGLQAEAIAMTALAAAAMLLRVLTTRGDKSLNPGIGERVRPVSSR